MKRMGQIVKRKKKGRPSKADLAKRREEASAQERDLRRSHRRRSVRYTFDFDDYLDDDELFEDFDEEDERRREKKLKLLLKLHSGKEIPTESTTPSQTRRVSHAPADSQSSSDYGGDGSKPSKKRKIDRGGGDDDGEEDEDENDDVDDNENEDAEDDEV